MAAAGQGRHLRYKKAPIVEAVIEVRWPSARPIESLEHALSAEAFSSFEPPKPRHRIEATFDSKTGDFKYDVQPLGFEAAARDGSEKYLIGTDRFAYIQAAPYGEWSEFSGRFFEYAMPLLAELGVEELCRVGVRFVNRIDAPTTDTEPPDASAYLNVSFDGPRTDDGTIKEFHMRVVKQTKNPNISYGLTVASVGSPLPNFSGILLDIDAFSDASLQVGSEELNEVLGELRKEKNHIFEESVTDQARELFGGRER